MNMKAIIKELTPPILIHVIRKRPLSKISYATYEEARLACQENDVYQNSNLINVVVDKNLTYREKLKFDPVFDFGSLRTLIPFGVMQNCDNIKVLDFGGGAGNHYTIAKTALGSERSIYWCIVETPAMSKQAQILADDNLSFFSDINLARNSVDKFDLVFSSSALQYCPEPLFFLRELLDLGAQYVFITRTPFLGNDKTIITTQSSKLSSNGPGALPSKYIDRTVSYPITYVSRKKVEEVITEKYDIRFRIDEGDGGFSFNNEPISMTGYFCVLKQPNITQQ